MKRTITALSVLALGTLALTAVPANAAVTRNVVWRCTLADGSSVDFVTAPDHAFKGLTTAQAATAHAMLVLGENCVVVRG